MTGLAAVGPLAGARRALHGAIVAALEGRKTARQALEDAQRDAERLLLRYQR